MNLFLKDSRAKILCLFGFYLWVWLVIYKYYNLCFYDWDLAFFSQAMWAISHGSTYVSLFDLHFFGNHANLIAYLIVPLFKIFPHPLTLLYLKIASFSIASFVLYLLAKERLGENLSLLVLALFWIYPANIYGLLYEFDFENLAPAFLMLMFYFYVHEKWPAFIINGILLILIKENLPLIVAAFGIHGLMTKSDKMRWGVVPLVLGMISFYVLAFIFVPLMGAHTIGQHPYAAHYSSLLKHWVHTLLSVFSFRNLKWYQYLLGPVIFLPVLAMDILMLAGPIILQHALSSVWQEHVITYSYSLTIAPFIFLSFIFVLGLMKEKIARRMFYLILIITVISSVFFFSIEVKHFKAKYMNLKLVKTAPYRWILLKKIPPEVPVVASFNFLPELSQRPYLYAFHKMYYNYFQNADRSYKLPENVHYALIDFDDEAFQVFLKEEPGFIDRRVKHFLASGWVPMERCFNIVIFTRKGSS